MVSRKTGWRIVTLAAAVYAAASAGGPSPRAMDRAPIPPGDIPNVSSAPSSSAPSAGRAASGRAVGREVSRRRAAPRSPPLESGYAAPATPRGANLVWGGPLPGVDTGYVPSPAYGDAAPEAPAFAEPLPEAAADAEPADLPPAEPLFEPSLEPGPGDYGRTYPVEDLRPELRGGVEPEDEPLLREASLPALDPPTVVDDGGAGYGAEPDASFDPWEGLTEVDPDAPEAEPEAEPPAAVAALPAYAPPASSPALRAPARPGRGALADRVPEGYRPLAKSEAMCRRELKRLGVAYRDVSRLASGGGCGIANPVRISQAVSGIAMSPPATMNCQAALAVAHWLRDEVKPAARWKLWKRPTAVINASSYRCSRIAGSRTISEHASGNALDVRGFRFADGSTVKVEPKSVFSFREKAFQTAIRSGSCRHFGTVLGPGYNRAHADHLHLDVKTRRRAVCK